VRDSFLAGEYLEGDCREGELLIQLELNDDAVCMLDEDVLGMAGVAAVIEGPNKKNMSSCVTAA
jgi:hypothetical protein